jgi:peroxiredoxin
LRSDQRQALFSLEALDFTLPDINGSMHSLSDLRGKKVLLLTWASW